MAGNKNLSSAARAKKDEFYTQIEDIERELRHEDYRKFFRGKIILCNCDDPYESDFFKYFAMNFNALELKKLIATCYSGSPISGNELVLPGMEEFYSRPRNEIAYKVEISELKDWNGDGREDLLDVKQFIQGHPEIITPLKGNGDFRSAECIEILKQADVVVTNPPFSLFREYVAQLMKYEKKFVVLGNKNAITYKEIFKLFVENKMFVGYTPMSKEIYFHVPQKYIDAGLAANKDRSIVKVHGEYVARSQAIWYTNIPLKKLQEEIFLVFNYSPEKYPRYDNYDAIEVSKTAEIPCDYFGVMGVPITFLDKYNPNQFEILGCTYVYGDCGCHVAGTSWGAKINGKDIYKRLFIRRKGGLNG